MNTKQEKFDIIIVAGQSNAEGCGQRELQAAEIIHNRVYHLIDANCVRGDIDDSMRQPFIPIIETAHEQACGDKKYANLSETFADKYLSDARLQQGRKILLIKAAVGGTSFAKKQWGIGCPLSNRLYQMADYALGLNNENRIVALLWHQGESDAIENAHLIPTEIYDFYYKTCKAQMTEIRERYKAFDFPIIAGEFVDDWANKNQPQCETVETAIRDICADIGNAAMVSSDELLSNDQSIHNGDHIHFCESAIYELGRRYYEAYKNLLK